MFGNNNSQPTNDDPAMLDSVKQITDDPAAAPAATVTPTQPAPAEPTATATTAHPEPAAGFSSMPAADVTTPTAAPAVEPVSAPAVPTPDPATLTPTVASVSTPAEPSSTPPTSDPTLAPAASTNDAPAKDVDHEQLAGMKQHALDHLEPLVEHLDQSAEEEFKTTMMMIQSNDNHTLLEKALVAAKKIEDDKVRAEALLDIINEINYFASQSTSGDNSAA